MSGVLYDTGNMSPTMVANIVIVSSMATPENRKMKKLAILKKIVRRLTVKILPLVEVCDSDTEAYMKHSLIKI